MLTPAELIALQRRLVETKVLSVYLDSGVTDPAMREAWRPTLQNVLREARSQIADAAERTEFDLAAALLQEPQPSPEGTWGAPGWVAFVTSDRPRYVGNLPVAPGTFAVWRDGPVIAPYLRALKQLRPVIVALVESGSVRLFRYAVGELEVLDELTVTDETAPRAGRPTRPSVAGVSARAPRGAVGSESASRRRSAAFERLTSSLVQRLVEFGGRDSWILIGGTSKWAGLAGEALARQFAGRMLVSATLDHDAGRNQIIDAAKRAATELRATQGAALVEQLIDRAGGHGQAAAGVPAIQRALRANAVDLLLVTPRFIGAHEGQVEDFVRAATAAGGDVEIPSGNAAERLDNAADGVAARLRFSIDQSPAAESNA